ncbi:hypothetical protein BC939DRAFT_443638 [Gamsiella multidivaricata]|uniref:uncharacterized protein n=1 Tax=Gamsiella multidivaricata TaxID=101098 RepID=UPI002220C70D|nr:uncharacterized protein BC939DRAFT_443638 [Gamsiella multidivaricata]KAI7828119.1 hypothetical protein BC939DRAFT_443638 [Gamsiella multidivaricata]
MIKSLDEAFVRGYHFIQQHIVPAYQRARHRYFQLPFWVQIIVKCFLFLSVCPIICFQWFLAVVILDSFVVGALVFIVVEATFAMFAGAFLLLSLYGALVITFGIGINLFLLQSAYKVTLYLVQDPRRRIKERGSYADVVKHGI